MPLYDKAGISGACAFDAAWKDGTVKDYTGQYAVVFYGLKRRAGFAREDFFASPFLFGVLWMLMKRFHKTNVWQKI